MSTDRVLVLSLAATLALGLAGCPKPTDTSDTSETGDTDADTDADTDSDTDADTDADTDSDTDTDLGDDSIYDIQSGKIANGTAVHIVDVVVTSPQEDDGFYVQEEAGGPYSGVFVYFYNLPAGTVERGDRVTVTGDVNEYFDMTEVSTDVIENIEVTGSGTIPAAQAVTYAQMDDTKQDATALEPLEGCLVSLPGGSAAVGHDQYGEWLATAAPNTPLARVDSKFYIVDAEAGDTFSGVIGPLGYAFDKFRISPRDAADLPDFTHPTVTCGATKCSQDLVAGDLVITEAMNQPNVGTDATNEWIEVYNATGGTVNLKGIAIVDKSNTQAVIATDAVVAAGDYAVIGTGDGTGWAYPAAADAYWGSSPALNNSGTESIAIKVGAAIIDDIPEYAAPGGGGASWQLGAGTPDAVTNNTLGNWCAGTAAIGTTGDFGTPGAANTACN